MKMKKTERKQEGRERERRREGEGQQVEKGCRKLHNQVWARDTAKLGYDDRLYQYIPVRREI